MFWGEAMRAGPRNNKLECFLKRSLTEERYERLRAYDSCIVDRKWRYLVLGDRCIYLTENPPRTLRKAILYRDLKAAQLVCDFPDFLRGQEREDTLHIALTHYKRKWPKKSLSSISLLNSSRNALLQKRRTSSTGQFSSPVADTKPGCHRKSSLDETILHNFNRMSLHLENSGDTLSSSMPSKLLASQKQNSFPMADLVECEAMSLAQGDTKRQVPLADKCMVGCNFMRKTPSKKKNKHADSKLTDSFVKPQGEDLAPPTRLSRPLPQLSAPTTQNQPPVVSIPTPTEQQECVLDVYILSHNSPMLAFIRCAWQNYLIRSTFQAEDGDDEEEEEAAITEIQPVSKQPELLFVQLKLELLQMSPSSCSVERMHTLCSKLQVYADTYFVVKRLFWKDPELLQLFVGILKKFLPSYYRAEQSLVIQVLDILQMMFRETENVPDRLKTLEISWQLIGDLLNLIAHFPSLQNESSSSFTLSNSTSQEQDDLSPSRFIKMFIALLFELFVCAQQKFVENAGENVNVVWMVNQLEEIGCEELIQRIVDLTLHLTQPRRQGSCLSPAHVLQLYQQGYILLTLLDHSTKLTEVICSNYFTEFKYLVQRHVIEKKIPSHYPLSHTLLTLIDKVLDKILN